MSLRKQKNITTVAEAKNAGFIAHVTIVNKNNLKNNVCVYV